MVAAFNQGDIGCCTGNALAGALMTQPLYIPARVYNEQTALSIYSQATHLFPVDHESYPPNDTGSSGPDVCKAAMKDSYIKSYHHSFDFNTTLSLLALTPVMIGANWYDSMDDINPTSGVVSIAPGASVRGGHEWELAEIDPPNQMVLAWNSWGDGWGPLGGAFKMSYATLEQLLSEHGDATVPVV